MMGKSRAFVLTTWALPSADLEGTAPGALRICDAATARSRRAEWRILIDLPGGRRLLFSGQMPRCGLCVHLRACLLQYCGSA